MTQLIKAIPHIPSSNMNETVRFFVDLLGFEVKKHSDSYAEVMIDEVVLGILSAQEEPNEQSLYLCVDDVDQLWEKLGPMLTELRFKAPFDQEYGMREIHIIVPHTNTLLFIGHSIAV